MTLSQIAEKIKELENNESLLWNELANCNDDAEAHKIKDKISVVQHELDNYKQLSFEMAVYPENFEYPETDHVNYNDIID